MIDHSLIPKGYTVLERGDDYLFTCKQCHHQKRIPKDGYTVSDAMKLLEHRERRHAVV